MKSRPYLGFVISLVANIPNFIIAIVYTAAKFISPDNDVVALAVRTVSLFLEGMYIGLMSKITVSTQIVGGEEVALKMFEFWWAYFIMIIPAVLTAGIAYWLGSKNIHFTPMMETQYPESDREPKKKWFGKKK